MSKEIEYLKEDDLIIFKELVPDLGFIDALKEIHGENIVDAKRDYEFYLMPGIKSNE